MRDLTVADAVFEPLEGGDHVLRVFATGSGWEPRAYNAIATVGDVPVDQIVHYPDGGGFSGVLATEPADGSTLRVGWTHDELADTSVTYHASGVA